MHQLFRLIFWGNMMKSLKFSINRIFLINMALVGVISIFSVGYSWITSELAGFEKEVSALRKSYMENQKKLLKREVNHALDFVNYMKSQTEKRLRDSIQGRVYEAYAIMENIYLKEKDTNSTEDIEMLLKKALRSLRFNNGRGYYFAFTLEGVESLFEIRPEMDGNNMLDVRGGTVSLLCATCLQLSREMVKVFTNTPGPNPTSKVFSQKSLL
jgi:hypothetical protein